MAYHTSMRLGLALLVVVGLLGPAIAARAHLADEFPQVTVQVAIDDATVDLIVNIPAKDAKLAVFDGFSPVEMDRLEPAELSAMVGRVFAQRCPVSIDGVVVPPTVLGAKVDMSNSRQPARRFPEAQVLEKGTLKFFARYETKGPPSRVTIDWSIYANEYDADGEPIHGDAGLQVVAVIEAKGQEQISLLTPQQPSYIWSAEDVPASPSDLQVRAQVHRDVTAYPTLTILILLIGGSVVLFKWRHSRRVPWVAVTVTVGLSAVAWPFAQTHISSPTYINAPSDEEQLAIFESLHRNIYRAFDYTDEGAVYDALAQSVAGPMLETIYNDVYQSLIIREEEDALSKVVRVEIENMVLLPIENDTGMLGEFPYRVRCMWEVDGLVTHFGHSHARTNAFEAIYTVSSMAAQWRIIDAEVLQQRRVDDGNQTAEDLLGEP